jgi:hypothetical protein
MIINDARARMASAMGEIDRLSIVHADKEPEPLNLGVPVVNFPRANAFLVRAQALLWVRDWLIRVSK